MVPKSLQGGLLCTKKGEDINAHSRQRQRGKKGNLTWLTKFQFRVNMRQAGRLMKARLGRYGRGLGTASQT